MIVGVDVVNMGRKSVVGLTATYNKYLHQHFSAVKYQELHKGEGLTKEKQEEIVCQERQ